MGQSLGDHSPAREPPHSCGASQRPKVYCSSSAAHATKRKSMCPSHVRCIPDLARTGFSMRFETEHLPTRSGERTWKTSCPIFNEKRRSGARRLVGGVVMLGHCGCVYTQAARTCISSLHLVLLYLPPLHVSPESEKTCWKDMQRCDKLLGTWCAHGELVAK